MKRLLTASVTALAVIGLAAPALAPAADVPFPAPKADIFVGAWTVTAAGNSLGAGIRTNYFAQGSSTVFYAFAGDSKTGKVLTDRNVKYFYVQIPGQPNVKLSFAKPGNAGSRALWTATWAIPADFPLGAVQFRVLVKTNSRTYGAFQQAPVATAQLTVTKA